METKLLPMNLHLKISVLGKGAVGKSSLIFRLLGYKFSDEHDRTIEDKYKTQIDIFGRSYEMGRNLIIYYNRDIRYCWTRGLSGYA